jgi:type III secretion system FlhB-like substrate exporter
VYRPVAAQESIAMSTKRVVGVNCDLEQPAPVVVVKGAGAEADAILAQARAADMPVFKDPALVEQLYRVPIDAAVGRELFAVMASLLAHVLTLDRERQESLTRHENAR